MTRSQPLGNYGIPQLKPVKKQPLAPNGETKGNTTRLCMGLNLIMYLLVITDIIVNNSYYFQALTIDQILLHQPLK